MLQDKDATIKREKIEDLKRKTEEIVIRKEIVDKGKDKEEKK